MELTYTCPRCEATGTVDRVEEAREVHCPCGMSRPLDPGACADGELRACPWCATADLYVQKDFPHGLGVGIVLAGFAISTVFWYRYMPVAALGVLMATALLDLVLYYAVPDVTICYRCQAQYRGRGSNPGGRFLPFDLSIGERYRQERLRIAGLKDQDRPVRSRPIS